MARVGDVVVVIGCLPSTCVVWLAHVVFLHFVAEWSVPTVTGDMPTPMDSFSFTKISPEQAAMFGGAGPGWMYSQELRIATFSERSVVSVSMAQE